MRLKGGSLTMLLLLPGVPATGEPPPAAGVARNAAAGYKHLSQEQRDKLLAALQRQARHHWPQLPELCVESFAL